MKFLLWVMIFLVFIGGIVATALWQIPWLFWGSFSFLTLCYTLLEDRRGLFGGSPPSISPRRFCWTVGVYTVFLVGTLGGTLGMGIFGWLFSEPHNLTAFVPFGVWLALGMQKGFVYTNKHGTRRLSYFDAVFDELPYALWKRRQTQRKK